MGAFNISRTISNDLHGYSKEDRNEPLQKLGDAASLGWIMLACVTDVENHDSEKIGDDFLILKTVRVLIFRNGFLFLLAALFFMLRLDRVQDVLRSESLLIC